LVLVERYLSAEHAEKMHAEDRGENCMAKV
jgi:hypothetical protein